MRMSRRILPFLCSLHAAHAFLPPAPIVTTRHGLYGVVSRPMATGKVDYGGINHIGMCVCVCVPMDEENSCTLPLYAHRLCTYVCAINVTMCVLGVLVSDVKASVEWYTGVLEFSDESHLRPSLPFPGAFLRCACALNHGCSKPWSTWICVYVFVCACMWPGPVRIRCI